ncbi:MAG: hypothetical protein QM749_13935 [Aquabacterium sp.]
MNTVLGTSSAVPRTGDTWTSMWWRHGLGALLVTGALFWLSMGSGGVFSYPLDDTYIHMALARTLATSGVWGLSPQVPAAASSSPLWTMLLAANYPLAGMLGQGADLFMPLLWNLAFGVALVGLNARILKDLPQASWLLFITWFCTGLPGVMAVSMEHVAHTFLITWFLYVMARRLGQAGPWVPSGRTLAGLALLTALAATARYESAFVMAPVVWLCVRRRAWRPALVIVVAAAAPLLAVGAVWVHAGGWMLPNSLLLKGAGSNATTDMWARFGALASNLVTNLKFPLSWVTFSLLIAHLALHMRVKPANEAVRIFSRVALVSAAAHCLLASFGWLYRYDAWIVELNLLSIFMQMPARPCMRWRGRPLSWPALCVVLLLSRFTGAYVQTTMAMDDRRWEHLMPSQFVREHLAHRTILVNDVGVFSYDGGATVVDLFGLGRNEPIRYRQAASGYHGPQVKVLADRLHGEVAIVQLCWDEVNQRLPQDWRLIGYWRGPRNVVFGDKIVAVFSVNPGNDALAREALLASAPYPKVKLFMAGAGDTDAYNQSRAAQRAAIVNRMCEK